MLRSLLVLSILLGTTSVLAHWGQQRLEYVRCESHNFRPNQCEAHGIRRVERVRLVQQHSKTLCEKDYNWRATRWGVEVKDGCRATFAISGW